MKEEPIQLLQHTENEQNNNFKLENQSLVLKDAFLRFVWVPAPDADLTTVVSLRESTNASSPRLVPAIYRVRISIHFIFNQMTNSMVSETMRCSSHFKELDCRPEK